METITVTDENRDMFEVFCQMHPHEAYNGNKDEFIRYAKKINPELSEESIINLINET